MGNDFFKTPSGNMTIVIDKELFFTLFIRVNIHRLEKDACLQLLREVQEEAKRRNCLAIAYLGNETSFQLPDFQFSAHLDPRITFWVPQSFWYHALDTFDFSNLIFLHDSLTSIEQTISSLDEDERLLITKMDLPTPCLKMRFAGEVISVYLYTKNKEYTVQMLFKNETIRIACLNEQEIEDVLIRELSSFYRRKRLGRLFG